MNHLHWMKLYIGDELSNTSHMTPAEFGSYILLKMHYWRFGSLPTDDERLARIARMAPDQWREIMPSIGPLFQAGWCDPKLEAQRNEAEEKHQARVEAGRRGGNAKKQSFSNASSNAGSKTEAKRKQPEPEPDPDPYSDPAPERDPDSRAPEKGNGGTYTRETMFTPYPIPASAMEGRAFLEEKGVPPSEMDTCLKMMMGGNLSPYELEGFLETRGAA